MKTRIEQFRDNIGKDIEGYFYLSDFRISSSVKGRYANATIIDRSGIHLARMWEESLTEREDELIGKVVRIIGKVTNYDGAPSLIIAVMSEADSNMYDEADIVKVLDNENEKFLVKSIHNAISSIEDKNLKELVNTIFSRYQKDFIKLPAGIRMHHNINGGLLIHTCEVVYLANAYCSIAKTMLPIKEYGYPADKDMVIAGALLHDIGKVEEYTGFPGARITKEGELLGHLNMGAQIVTSVNEGLKESNAGGISDERLCELNHIILASHGVESFIKPKSLEAIIVSRADEFSAMTDFYGVAASEDKRINPNDPAEFFYSKSQGQRFLRKKGEVANV